MKESIEGRIRVELKYCERCGGLWFRRSESGASLCGSCTVEEPRVAGRYRLQERSGKGVKVGDIDSGALRVCGAGGGTPCEKQWLGPMSAIVESLQGVAMGRIG